jgi:hypothetical protein
MATLEQLKAAYAEEQIHPYKARTLADVPINYEAITPEWLTAAICRGTPDAAVTGFEIVDRSNGSSNRARLRLRYNEAGIEAKLPPTVFCKAAEKLESRLTVGRSGCALAEVDFFAKVRPRLDIEAPVGFHGGFNPDNCAYIVVMHDLGVDTPFSDEHTVITRARAEAMVTLLARFHATFYQNPDLETPALPYLHWSDWWRRMMEVSPDFGASCDIGFDRAESVVPPRLFKRRGEIWPLTEESVSRQRHLPSTLIHNDVHVKNWYIKPDGTMGLGDWQIITAGHWSRDLIYALSVGLTVENRRAWDRDLIRLYLEKSAEYGMPRIPLDEALLYCRQQLLSVLAFWTITLQPARDMPDMQPVPLTLAFMERITHAMDDLDALDSFG